MELSEIQHTLSRLYTEVSFRNEFFLDKQRFYQSTKITSFEVISFFNELQQEQVDFFAKGLLSKRYHAILKLMPGTSFMLEEKFYKSFIEYSTGNNPAGIHKHHADALAFCDFIRNKPAQKSSDNPYLNDMMRFERRLIRNFLAKRNWSISYYGFNPFQCRQIIQNGERPSLVKSTTFVVWKEGQIRKIFSLK